MQPLHNPARAHAPVDLLLRGVKHAHFVQLQVRHEGGVVAAHRGAVQVLAQHLAARALAVALDNAKDRAAGLDDGCGAVGQWQGGDAVSEPVACECVHAP